MTKAVIVNVDGEWVITAEGAGLLSALAGQATSAAVRAENAATQAVDSAEQALESANYAEEFSGPAYDTVGDGEAATAAGHFFRVPVPDTDPVEYTRYQRTAGGSVEAASLATTSSLAADNGAGLVGAKRVSPGASYLTLLSEIRAGMARPDQFDLPTSGDQGAAVNRAAVAAEEEGVGLDLAGHFSASTSIQIPAGVRVLGRGQALSSITSSASTAVQFLGGGSELSDLSIKSTNAQHIALWGIDVDAPSVTRCSIDGRSYFRNDTADEKRGPLFDSCYFPADFGADYDGIEQMDVITALGFMGPRVDGCVFEVNNVHRLVKISDATGSFTPVEPSEDNSRAFMFTRNIVRGIGGKQVMDLYMGTSAAHITNNHFELSDDTTISGARWSCLLENKTAAGQRDIYDIGAAIIFSENTGYIGSAQLIGLQGDYGITQSGYSGDRYNTAKITNNDLRRTVDSAIPLIEVRFFNEVYSDGNTWEIPKVANRSVTSHLSNEQATIGGGDTYRGGNILFGTALTNADGSTFSGKTGTVEVGAATVRDFDCDGAIQFVSLNADLVNIRGLKSRPATSPTRIVRAAHFASTSALARLNIQDMDAVHPSGGNVNPVLDAVAATAIGAIRDNSWQPRFRGFVTAVPTTGTFALGDWVTRANPSLGQVAEWVCVSAGSPGTWSATKWVVGAGTTAQRPVLTSSDVGVLYFDSTLGNKPILWRGSVWTDGDGASV